MEDSNHRSNLSTLPLSAGINRKVGRAMHDYSMLAEGDRVLIGISGGVDSVVLAWLLHVWRQKAPIDYRLKAVFIDHGYWSPDHGGSPPAEQIGARMAGYGIDYAVVPAREYDGEHTCYNCARSRRHQLFELARRWQMNKIALGHHLDDLLETLLLNMIYSGNISTMVPRQTLFASKVDIIRPLAYLEKDEVEGVAALLEVEGIDNCCPLAKDTRREQVRSLLVSICAQEPGAKKSLFRAMANVREDYLLGKS